MISTMIHLPYGGGTQDPNTIIIHAMAEYIICDKATSEYYKDKKNLKIIPGIYHALRWLDVTHLSAHCLITPEGMNIRMREDNEIAWHAKAHNIGTLGLEVLVPGEHTYPTFLKHIDTDYVSQWAYRAVKEQVKRWLDTWAIRNITTHHAIDPVRKKDPGKGFPMTDLLKEVS